MYAIIEDRGHQYKVQEGDLLLVDKMAMEKGAAVTFDKVLLVGKDSELKVGNPSIAGARVLGTVEDHPKGQKVIAIRRVRTNKHVVRTGHRKQFSLVKIQRIEA